jgi:hypothetical protein
VVTAHHKEVPATVIHLLIGQHRSLSAVHAEAELNTAIHKGEAKEVTDATIIKVEEQPRGDIGLELKAQVAACAGIPAEVTCPLVGEAHEFKA